MHLFDFDFADFGIISCRHLVDGNSSPHAAPP